MAWFLVQVVVQRWSGSSCCGLYSKVRRRVARESDLGQSPGLGASIGGVAQLVVACARESAMREGVNGRVL